MRVIATPAFSNRSLNPYNFLLYRSIEQLGNVVWDGFWIWTDWHADIWHVHWPEGPLSNSNVFRALAGTLAVLLNAGICRLLGVHVVWTVHNIRPHERRWPLLERVFYSIFPKLVDRFVFLSESTRQEGVMRIRNVRESDSVVIPHGHYRDALGQTPERKQARAMVGVPAEVMLVVFFGQVRPYKNVPMLIKAFAGVSGDRLNLAVVGSPGKYDALSQEVQGLAARDPRVVAILRHLSDDELAAWVSAADLVVLPYRDIANSGCAMFSLSLNSPVLVPNKGAMGELKGRVGEEWVRVYDGELTSQELVSAIEWVEKMAAGRPDLGYFDWDSIAAATVAAYEDVIGKVVH